MGYQYTYLLMALVFLAIWLALFIWRKNTRKEMMIMSLIFAFAGPLADILYTKDWWLPLTLTNTAIGPEAILVGFMIGGIASVIYEDIFKKRLKIRKVSKTKEAQRNFSFLFIISISVILFFGSFYLLKFNSLVATILALIVPTIIIWIKRKDLILDSLATGVFLVIVASLVYSVLEFLTPGWIHAFWFFKNVPDIIIFNLPVDDIIWYFLAGLFIGPLYEYWQESKLVDA
jgi:hypothetical protein